MEIIREVKDQAGDLGIGIGCKVDLYAQKFLENFSSLDFRNHCQHFFK
jgi:hypothetical protein